MWYLSFSELSMIISTSFHLLLQVALFHSSLAESDFEPKTAWLPDFMYGAMYMV